MNAKFINKGEDAIPALVVGDDTNNYTLTVMLPGDTNEHIFLRTRDGEGMGIDPADFYDLLDKYYRENF